MAFAPAFDFDEATAALAMSQAIYGVPGEPVPTPDPKALGWAKVEMLTPSIETLLDNYWEIWRDETKPNRYAVVVRGTVETAPSVIADLLFPLVDARMDFKFKVLGQEVDIPFHLARNEAGSAVVAGTHLGFTLSLLLMLVTTDRPLLATLMLLSQAPDAEILITGHSQGASIATLLASFAGHASGPFASLSKAAYKTYVFAPAKPGNDHYSYDFSALFGVNGQGWTILSTQGWVPQVPFTLQFPSDLNTPNPLHPYGQDQLTTDHARFASLETAESAAAAARDAMLDTAHTHIEMLTAKLAARNGPIGKIPDGTGDMLDLEASELASTLKGFLGSLQLSLNYAYAGNMVPLFATPGANPHDPSDYFWQHHLGNYWIYLQQQYENR